MTWFFVGIGDDHAGVGALVDGARASGIDDDSPIGIALVAGVDASCVHRLRDVVHQCDRTLAVLLDADAEHACPALLDAGASDVVVWRGDVHPIVARVQRWNAIEAVMRSSVVRDNLIGDSRAWRRLLRDIVEIARFTSASVLLGGESGTGKELVARLIHTLDSRPDKGELVTVDCTTIVETLAGSELFGHERGAYTGAVGARDGAFALADRGTLFLDEVADLSLPLQAQLLRAIQERTYKRVGGNDWQRAEFRLVCATHRDLQAAVARGEFRHDLYQRIATWQFRMPALRDRREDIPALVAHFLRTARRDGTLALEAGVTRYLVERGYPGNIRELRHTVQRLVDRYPGAGPVTIGQIPDDERPQLAGEPAWPDDAFESAVHRAVTSGVGLKSLRKTTEDIAVRIALALDAGNIPKASRRLGVTERALQLRQAARRDEQVEPEEPN